LHATKLIQLSLLFALLVSGFILPWLALLIGSTDQRVYPP